MKQVESLANQLAEQLCMKAEARTAEISVVKDNPKLVRSDLLYLLVSVLLSTFIFTQNELHRNASIVCVLVMIY